MTGVTGMMGRTWMTEKKEKEEKEEKKEKNGGEEEEEDILTDGPTGQSKVVQEVLADLKTLLIGMTSSCK